jgi:hypothetical protein
MVLTEDDLAEAQECLAKVDVKSFSATPTTITPFGGPSTITWKATRPDSCPDVTFSLNFASVSATGSLEVHPSVTTEYRLQAIIGNIRRTLGTVTVVMDSSLCFSSSIDESEISETVQSAVADFDARNPRISQRALPTVELEAAGLVLHLRFTINLDDFVDPKLDIDCTIQLRAENGEVIAAYKSFSIDVDWPWWVTVTFPISKALEEILDKVVEKGIRPRLLQEVQDAFDPYLDMIPSDSRLFSVATVHDRIDYTVCKMS